MDEVMSKAIAEPRKEVNEWAPKIEQITIDPSKIGDVISQMMALFQFAEQIKR